MENEKQEIVMILGYPSSGKTFESKALIKKEYVNLNRDKIGGSIADLVPKLEDALSKNQSVVLDNLFPNPDVRKPFLDLAKKYNVPCRAIVIGTSIEDAQINALNRMWDNYGTIFYSSEDIRKHPKAKNDSSVFPVAVFYKYRKEYIAPEITEGFSSIEKTKFIRDWSTCKGWTGKNKALILDSDGTLRTTKGNREYPIHPIDIEILPNRTEVLNDYASQGYMLLGVSNQSGVAKGDMTYQECQECFDETNRLLGVDIEHHFSPAKVPPIVTYCRKPLSGIGVHLIRKHNLNPANCIYVGDMTVDKSFAERLGFQFHFANKFFKVKNSHKEGLEHVKV